MSNLPALRAAWRQQQYAEAGGAAIPSAVIQVLGLRRGDMVYDFGCGDGQLVDFFNNRGIVTLGMDMIKAHDDTVLCNLTEFSDVHDYSPRQYGVCLGMMDHVPENRVAQTLINLNHLARGEIYFTIPIRDLGYNDLVGKKVQQTIKPIGWWRNHLTAIGKVKIGQFEEWMTAHVQCN